MYKDNLYYNMHFFQVCILNVGSNNIDNTSVEIAEGILVVVNEISSKLPDCYIIIIVRKFVSNNCFN